MSIGEGFCKFFSKPKWAPGVFPDTYKPGYELGAALTETGRALKDTGGVLIAAHQKANESLLPTISSTAESLQGVARALRSLPEMSNYIFIISIAASLFVIIGGLFLVAAMRALASTSEQEVKGALI